MTTLKRIYETEGEMPDTHNLIAETLEKEGIEVYIVTYQRSESIYNGKIDWVSVKEQDFERAKTLINALINADIL